MRNKWIWAACALPVVLLAVYMALPWYSAHKLIEAAHHQDLETMERYVDFPQLRSNMRKHLLEELQVSMERELSPELGKLFSAGADILLAPLLDHLISPRGISDLIQGQKDWSALERELEGIFGGSSRPSPPSVPPGQSPDEHERHWQLQHWRFTGLNTVEVICGNRNEEPEVQLLLLRKGLHWRLVDIRLIAGTGE
ncbi:DUF2939 domain-containing protein [Microbulbifer pacificus]|uniref:DUF2939 domain-containing protein n=1 Tax=Microbulbifer pacificus TaxID=407164 RepID=UPI000CF43691|nr:DUF2939 domain-containing protein [Microbulbifer pacificus]